MYNSPVTKERLAASVWAVPPLPRRTDGSLDATANKRLIAHIESGGISTLLYGGNAILYHVAPSEYRDVLEIVAGAADDDTLVVPAVGPAYGTMMDQATLLQQFDFPTAMILPQRDVASSAGVATAARRFAESCGAPIVLYLKHDRAVDPADVGRLMEDGALSAIKYAVPRDDDSDDPYLQALVDAAGTDRMLSGLGDQPARTHMRRFGLAGFTTGCGCVAPNLCRQLLAAIKDGDDARAAEIEALFLPLEDLRNGHGPITVLHAAVELAGIAPTGPVIPLLTEVDAALREPIRTAAKELLEADATATRTS